MSKYDTVFLCEKDSQVQVLSTVLKAKYTKKWSPAYNDQTKTAIVPLKGHLLKNLDPQEYDPMLGKFGEHSIYVFPDQQRLKPAPNTVELLNTAIRHLQSANKIIIATDCDNEGAAIAMNVIRKARCENKIERMISLASTHETEVKKAINEPNDIDYIKMADAANARSFIDWAEGMSFSRALTYYLGAGETKFNFGGVKTPIIYIVVQRDLAFENHQASYYYTASGQMRRGNDLIDVVLKRKYINDKDQEVWTEEFETEEQILKALGILANSKLRIEKVTRKQSKNSPPKLYNLSELQIDMFNKHNIDITNTMAIAQKLYDYPVSIQTYPRTDTPYLKEAEYADVKPILIKLAKHQVVDPNIVRNILQSTIPKRKTTFKDEEVVAHGAIVPTLSGDLSEWLGQLSDAEKMCFTLVSKRYTANFMQDYEYIQVNGNTTDIDGFALFFSEQVPVSAGWKEIYSPDAVERIRDYSPMIPDNLKAGDEVSLETMEHKRVKTKPKPRFTEATLLAATSKVANLFPDSEEIKTYLGEHGIGTESTRSIIIHQLFDEEFNKGEPWLVYNGKQVISTPKARNFIAMLPEDLVSPIKRAFFSKELKDVEKGVKSYDGVVDMYRTSVQDTIELIKRTGQQRGISPGGRKFASQEPSEALGACPQCQSGTIHDRGKIYMCSNAKIINDGGVFTNEGCNYRIFKGILQRFGKKEVTQREVKELLKKGSVEVTLKNSKGSYKAKLIPNMEYGVGVDFSNASSTPKNYKNIGVCPLCGGQVLIKEKVYECENKKVTQEDGQWVNKGSCSYCIFKSSLQKFGKPSLSDSEVRNLLKNGSVKVDLVSNKTRKAFSATLYTDDQYGVRISFD
ncbi:DNA topoisomerase [Campylobacter sp. MOP7]|uniref:type IA DNA topoisomerase n=1 Tax=Campylobacter canis TaxID=3378588 RepID=UPI00387E9A00